MEFRKIGDTDLKLSVITFGAWAAGGWMWGSTNKTEAVKAIRAAYDEGVTSIDTAPIYGQGTSEEIVGQAIEGINRDKVQILTKFGMRWDLAKGDFAFRSKDNDGRDIDIYKYAGKESIIRECEDSLRRLKTDYIDLYQIHWPDTTTPQSETFEAVERLIEQGKVRYAGVCNYSVELLEEAGQYIDVVSDQIPFSMVNRDSEKEIMPYCMRHGKAVIVYSPLERGLLTGKMTPGYHFPEGDHRSTNPYFTDDSIRRTNAFLEKIHPLAREKNASVSQLVLYWTINQPGVTVALVGARNPEQAVSNAHAVRISLTRDEMTFINDELKAMGEGRINE